MQTQEVFLIMLVSVYTELGFIKIFANPSKAPNFFKQKKNPNNNETNKFEPNYGLKIHQSQKSSSGNLACIPYHRLVGESFIPH